MKSQNATLWATIPQVEHSFGTGVYTQVCVAVSRNDRHGNPQEVVFILVSGADDEAMEVGGEFATFSECRAEWEVS